MIHYYFFFGAIMFKVLVAGGQAQFNDTKLDNELMEIKVKNFKIVGDKNAFHYY